MYDEAFYLHAINQYGYMFIKHVYASVTRYNKHEFYWSYTFYYKIILKSSIGAGDFNQNCF